VDCPGSHAHAGTTDSYNSKKYRNKTNGNNGIRVILIGVHVLHCLAFSNDKT